MEFPYFEVEFTKDGPIFQPSQGDRAVSAIRSGPTTDLLVVCHGWNNDKADARDLYERLVQKISEVLAGGIVPGLGGRSFAVLGVLWPSKKFTDAELIPGGGASTAGDENIQAILKLLEELKNDPMRLGEVSIDPARSQTLDRAKALVPRLEADPAARDEFVRLLRSVIDPASAHADDGSDAFFRVAAQELFAQLSQPVQAPAATGGGGATAVDGGAAGLSDQFSGIIGAARRLANFTTYFQMKERAGKVGSRGLALLIRRLRQAKPAVRVHLIGHSFGGRVVTAAAAGLDGGTPAVTLTLLQAAYSHNGLAERFDGVNNGFFRTVVADRRISGPIVISYTKNDKAVGIAYPLASRIADDKATALGDANDPYGGMGRNGAQRTGEVAETPRRLLDLGEFQQSPYQMRPGAIYNLNSDRVIKDHSDICHHEVACAFLASAAVV
jgi:pimeloyl-ACP methyl ester carboxylesterase